MEWVNLPPFHSKAETLGWLHKTTILLFRAGGVWGDKASKLNLLAGAQEETSQEVPKGWEDKGHTACHPTPRRDFSASIPRVVQKRHTL